LGQRELRDAEPEDWYRAANELGRLVEQASRDDAARRNVIAKLCPTESGGTEAVFKEFDEIRGVLYSAAMDFRNRAEWFQERVKQAQNLFEAVRHEIAMRERTERDEQHTK
jgi:hypothetical protein